MPILPRVGRRRLKMRCVIVAMYMVLSLGGLCMLIPFMITLTQSVSNYYDIERYDLLPRYLFSREERYVKSVAQLFDFGELFPDFRCTYKAPPHWGTYRDIAYDRGAVSRHFPLYGAEQQRAAQLAAIYADYCAFVDGYDLENTKLLSRTWNIRNYQKFLLGKYGGIALRRAGIKREDLSTREYERAALSTMGEIARTGYESITSVVPSGEFSAPFDLQTWFPSNTPSHEDYVAFMQSRPAIERLPVTRQFLWTNYLFNKNIELDGLSWPGGSCPWSSLFEVPFNLPEDAPQELRAARESFLTNAWPVRLVRLPATGSTGFHDFVRSAYPSLEALNQLTGQSFLDWSDVPFYRTANEYVSVALRSLWRDFALSLPRTDWELLCPEVDYQRMLMDRYGSLEAINRAYGWNARRLEDIMLPVAEAEYWYFVEHEGWYVRNFLTQSYAFVVDFLLCKGRAVWNTIALVALTIAGVLTVNPLAAYALSRFRPRMTSQVLLFLLAGMAFPPMVSAIPAFLLLRDLGMLNTFWALVLPGMVNGYAIFVLKGFFDSIPPELYEAALIDGARERQIFRLITIPLSRPVLAVVALNVFLVTYGGFVWALIVCPDRGMWTVMVWLMQFYTNYRWMPFVTTAGLVLVSLPTLVVFVLCQKVILRGIVVPQMK